MKDAEKARRISDKIEKSGLDRHKAEEIYKYQFEHIIKNADKGLTFFSFIYDEYWDVNLNLFSKEIIEELYKIYLENGFRYELKFINKRSIYNKPYSTWEIKITW